MKFVSVATLVLGAAVLLAGCQSAAPTSVPQFRSQASKKEVFTVHRSYRAALAGIARGARKCLAVRKKIVIEHASNWHGSTWYDDYTPTLHIGRRHSEFRLQLVTRDAKNRVVGEYSGERLPSNGWYILIADIDAAGAYRTRITALGDDTNDNVSSALKYWAQGSSISCPDLAGVN